MRFETYKKLFDTRVLPVLNYGGEMRGHKHCQKLETVLRRKERFNGARSTCQREGGDLVIISDTIENEFVKNLFLMQEDVDGSAMDYASIGLSDADQELVYVWIDGSTPDYLNWAPNEPSNSWEALTECLHKCLQQPSCLSANFREAVQSNNNICVLNAATTKEHYAVLGITGESYYGTNIDEWVYLELLN
ncbi:hypothetical protein LSH36_133g05087 [Paralvinella palmiformis]|uniref:C-type lectin domain-containing protein n=1 Tax=Paralvinella palmiformis TaxID=53620 RepID=A0AAD9JXE1_9ANNE|nr:hypothetical protein LSH36_133g05087 [Paralvinella palmiformis]